jgi:hypothetical protein
LSNFSACERRLEFGFDLALRRLGRTGLTQDPLGVDEADLGVLSLSGHRRDGTENERTHQGNGAAQLATAVGTRRIR